MCILFVIIKGKPQGSVTKLHVVHVTLNYFDFVYAGFLSMMWAWKLSNMSFCDVDTGLCNQTTTNSPLYSRLCIISFNFSMMKSNVSDSHLRPSSVEFDTRTESNAYVLFFLWINQSSTMSVAVRRYAFFLILTLL